MVSFCEWALSRGGIVTSRRHIGRTSSLYFISVPFFCQLFGFLGLAAERHAGTFFGCSRKHRYVQCPLRVYVFSLSLMLFIDCCFSKPATVRLKVARSVPILTAVVTVVFDSPALHSIRFHPISFYVPLLRFCKLHSAFIFTLVLLLFVSSTVTFVGKEVAVRDSVVSCSRPRSCFNVWTGVAAEDLADGVLLSWDLFPELIDFVFLPNL